MKHYNGRPPITQCVLLHAGASHVKTNQVMHSDRQFNHLNFIHEKKSKVPTLSKAEKDAWINNAGGCHVRTKSSLGKKMIKKPIAMFARAEPY